MQLIEAFLFGVIIFDCSSIFIIFWRCWTICAKIYFIVIMQDNFEIYFGMHICKITIFSTIYDLKYLFNKRE
jgi:hypothetical protein